MSDQTPIVPADESAEPNAGASSSSHTRIVHFPRISEDVTATNGLSAAYSTSSIPYEELTHESVPCPSCDGSGRIPKEREKQLVALIPLTDKRLKPRRTTLYVMVAVLASVVVCGLCMFFLIPRSITLSSSGFDISPYRSLINESEPRIELSFVNAVNITNNNYVAITVVNSTMTTINLLDTKHVVGQATNMSQYIVPLRSSAVVGFNTSISFDTKFMIDYCKFIDVIYMQFDVMVTSSYFGHYEQSSLTINQKLYCKSRHGFVIVPAYPIQ